MIKPPPKALIFDLDDTLLAHSAANRKLLPELCGKYGSHWRLDPTVLLEALVEASRWFWSDPERHRQGRLDLGYAKRRTVEEAFAKLDLPFDAKARQLSVEMAERRSDYVEPFPGALETLVELSRRGFLLGLITNGAGEVQREKIDRWNLARFFDAIWIEGERGVGKPEPRAFGGLLQELGVASSEAWVIGDHLEWEVDAPQRLGMRAVWVDHRGRGLPPGSTVAPDLIVQSVSELLTAFPQGTTASRSREGG